ncbi:MAG: diguanylate cyclase [Spirochaetia bacterium]|jgi:diguanylate cyclase (GGDEF)-like protein|nr:diguanylate cyclase [Spirochaetia bacterium]
MRKLAEPEPSSLEDIRHLKLLHELIEATLDENDLDGTTRILATHLARIIDADGCFMAFWDADSGEPRAMAASGIHHEQFASFIWEPDDCKLVSIIVQAGRSLVVDDILTTDFIRQRITQQFSTRSLIAIPMLSDGAIMGVYFLTFRDLHHFTQDEIGRSEHAARHASFAIKKLLLLEQERSRSAELAALNTIGMAINSGHDLDRVIATILEQCKTIIELDTFYIALYKPETDELSFPLFHDAGKTIEFETRCITGRLGLSGHIIKTRKPLNLPDTLLPETKSRYDIVRVGGNPSRAYIGVPLIHGDRVLGVLSVQSRRPNVYTEHHVRLVETIAAQSAIAIENASLIQELLHQACTDGLTGTINYRHLQALGPMELAKSLRYKRPMALLFFDVDNFRDFNSRYGHETGNDILKAVVDRVRSCIREIDLLARFGGEEFVVVLPETPPDEAAIVAERLRVAVEELRVSSMLEPEGLRVTVSVGVASLSGAIKSFQDLVNKANESERLAKELGRNRVEIAVQP